MQSSDTDQILSRTVRVLKRRKLLLLLCFVAVLVPIGIYNQLQTPLYQASTMLVFEEINAGLPHYDDDTSRDITLANRLEEFGSYSFHQDIAQALPLETLQRFPFPSETPPGFDAQTYVVSTIHKSLEAYSVRNSNIVKVSVTLPDPELCAVVANTAASVFQERAFRIKQEGTTGVRQFIEQQLHIFAEKLEKSEESLKQYKETHNVVSFQSEAQEILRRATEAEVLYNSAKTNRQASEERLQAVQAEIAKQRRTLVPSITESSSPWAQQLRTRLVDLQTQYMQLKVQNYQPSHPKMVQLEQQIEQTKKDLAAEVMKLAETLGGADPMAQMQKYFADASSLQIEIESLKAQEQALGQVMRQYDTSLGTLPSKELNLAQLERERDVNQKIYTNLLEKLEESKITEAEKIPTIRIIDEAQVPKAPIRPRKKLNLAVGAVFALVVGIGLGWIQDAAAPVGSVAALEELTGWPVLASIPRIEKLPRGKLRLHNAAHSRAQVRRIKRHIYSQIEPYSAVAESYRMLRTNLQFLGLGDRYRTVLVTSIGAGEGKSTMLSNLAITLAKLGQKTLILDSEVRRPVQHTAFDVNRGPGLSEVLFPNGKNGQHYQEEVDQWLNRRVHREDGSPQERLERLEDAGPKHLDELMETAVKPVRIKNLQILTSGEAWSNPSITVSNFVQRMKVLLQQMKQKYDVILVDAPPIMLVHDAAVVATMVDAVVFVVNSARIDEEALHKAKQLLENARANVLGIVLNHFEPAGVYGSYYAYYRELEKSEAEAART